MVKRAACAVLWFFAVAWGFNYISILTGVPAIIGMALAAAVATGVYVDPLHWLWPARVAARDEATPDPVPGSPAVRTRA